MAWFPQQALNDGVRKREVFGWAMYDFANSGYTTVVLTAVFNAYFVAAVAGGADWATLAGPRRWALSRAVVHGDDADAGRLRRRARRQEAAADDHHRAVRADHRGAGGSGPGRRGTGHAC